ncbi:MAG: dephospho-CoA kinase [Phycisphaerales bacterium]
MSHARSSSPSAISTRPHAAFVLFHRPWAWLVPGLLLLAAANALARANLDVPYLRPAGGLWLLVGFLWRVLSWRCRAYQITDGQMQVRKGVIWRVAATVPLARVQHVTVTRSPLERLLGLGTVEVSTADGPALAWVMVSNADSIQRTIGDALPGAVGPCAHAPWRRIRIEPPVIGIAGGIGAGKSAFARALEALGCIVVDSDREARAALELPEVRERLREWWGDRPFGTDGKVDRSAVAAIVFADEAERKRLEGLIHPMLKRKRAAMKAEAAARGVPAMVVDAPLLFEAGVDAECDAVVFVDSPREARLERVLRTRGWDEAEFDRRERAQMDVTEKKQRSTMVVENTGDAAALATMARDVLAKLLEGQPARRVNQ